MGARGPGSGSEMPVAELQRSACSDGGRLLGTVRSHFGSSVGSSDLLLTSLNPNCYGSRQERGCHLSRPMDRCRSYFYVAKADWTPQQHRQFCKDQWYCTAHSASDRAFIEVPKHLVLPLKRMVRSRVIHDGKDLQNQFPSNYARSASRAAWESGHISHEHFCKDSVIHSQRNCGKHPTVI